jgi:hypothetical protein
VNKRDNPYTPGAGPETPVLAGRDPDQENAGGLAASVVIGGVAGLYPAIRAAKVAPTEALAAT